MRREQQDNTSDESEPEIIDGQTGLVCPTPRTINLSNARDLRLEMAYLYRRVDRGEMESGEMNKRIWALGEMLKAYAMQEIETRIERLEERSGRRDNGPGLSGGGASSRLTEF